ncbi:DNA primase large subunit PriL [Methanosphaera sp.]
MIKTSFINPFSSDAKEIVSNLGQIENLDKENETLITIINYTRGQLFGHEMNLPKTLKQLAEKKFEWYLSKKSDKFNDKEYEYLFNPEIYEYDIVSFYLLCQAVAIGFGPDSREAKQVVELERDLIDQRLERLKAEPNDFQSNFLRTTLNQLIDTNNIYWTDLKDVIEMGEFDLNNLLLSKGRLIIEYEDFIEEYGELIQHRDPRSMYEVTGGLDLKSNLLKSIIMLHTKQYIQTVAKMAERMIEPNPLMDNLAENLRNIQEKAQEQKYGSRGKGSFNDNQPVSYEMEAFPPCVRKCMQGIKSGGRNDAIVLFLTPFISYARLYPGIFSEDKNMKISEVDPSLDITLNEVIPMIYDAAEACSPPLFKDQPQEKININSKLGFGMHADLKLDHEGETQWYTPMSCEKIKLHMSSLCTPSVDCKKIGNPLTYYNRKRKLMKRNNNNNKGEQVNNNGN